MVITAHGPAFIPGDEQKCSMLIAQPSVLCAWSSVGVIPLPDTSLQLYILCICVYIFCILLFWRGDSWRIRTFIVAWLMGNGPKHLHEWHTSTGRIPVQRFWEFLYALQTTPSNRTKRYPRRSKTPWWRKGASVIRTSMCLYATPLGRRTPMEAESNRFWERETADCETPAPIAEKWFWSGDWHRCATVLVERVFPLVQNKQLPCTGLSRQGSQISSDKIVRTEQVALSILFFIDKGELKWSVHVWWAWSR